eukprot:SAG22_NODE_597_length_8708_cov_11.511209_4_plen_221_part_00
MQLLLLLAACNAPGAGALRTNPRAADRADESRPLGGGRNLARAIEQNRKAAGLPPPQDLESGQTPEGGQQRVKRTAKLSTPAADGGALAQPRQGLAAGIAETEDAAAKTIEERMAARRQGVRQHAAAAPPAGAAPAEGAGAEAAGGDDDGSGGDGVATSGAAGSKRGGRGRGLAARTAAKDDAAAKIIGERMAARRQRDIPGGKRTQPSPPLYTSLVADV